MNLSRFIERNAADRPGKRALSFAGESATYAELWQRVLETIQALAQLGVRRGDRVAYLGYNHPDQLILLFALAYLGAILVPLNARLAAREQRAVLADSGAGFLFREPPFTHDPGHVFNELGLVTLSASRDNPASWRASSGLSAATGRLPAPAGGEDDPVLLVYTAGTSGKPKGALLTQANLVWNTINAVHVHEMFADDHVLAFLPMFHVGGLAIQVLPALYTGATTTLLPRFDPSHVLDAIARVRPSFTLTVPSTLRALVAHPRWNSTDLSSLKLIVTGSMDTPESLILAAHARGVPIGQVYGATEAGPIVLCLRRDDALSHVGAVGKPAPHVDIRLVRPDGRDAATGEAGELWVRGPNVIREYWRDPEVTRVCIEGGWFKTGDIAVRDDSGFYRIRGRSTEVINCAGESIYPSELENILADCTAIAQAAVVGVEDAQRGEVAAACIVRRPGAELDEARVNALFEGRLAPFKHPRHIVFMDALPRNALGKVQKFALKQQLCEGRIRRS